MNRMHFAPQALYKTDTKKEHGGKFKTLNLNIFYRFFFFNNKCSMFDAYTLLNLH